MDDRFTVVKMRKELVFNPQKENFKIYDNEKQRFGLAIYNNIGQANFYADKQNMKNMEVKNVESQAR